VPPTTRYEGAGAHVKHLQRDRVRPYPAVQRGRGRRCGLRRLRGGQPDRGRRRLRRRWGHPMRRVRRWQVRRPRHGRLGVPDLPPRRRDGRRPGPRRLHRGRRRRLRHLRLEQVQRRRGSRVRPR
jgi:hypothetical protein